MILIEKYQARFWAKVALPNEQGCMLWMAYVDPLGYGRFGIDGGQQGAHRISYKLAYGPIPEGLVIDHLCRVRHCVAPDHLEAVTQRENITRGTGWAAFHARKTHCPQGHAYSEENTYVTPRGDRRCRICADAHRLRYRVGGGS